MLRPMNKHNPAAGPEAEEKEEADALQSMINAADKDVCGRINTADDGTNLTDADKRKHVSMIMKSLFLSPYWDTPRPTRDEDMAARERRHILIAFRYRLTIPFLLIS